MANLRDIRRRIKSVKNTAQITKAMQMVAASRMRRAQIQALAGRPYAQLLDEIAANLSAGQIDFTHPLLVQRPIKKIGVLVVTTDKGLCGALNTNLLRDVIHNDAPNKVYVTVGRKGRQTLSRLHKELLADFEIKDNFTYRESKRVSSFLLEKYMAEEIDAIEVYYSHFINTISQKPTMVKLAPITREEIEIKESGQRSSDDYIFEPSAEALLNDLLPFFVHQQIYQFLLDARASEHSARMVAMKNATDNAKQLVKDLTLEYNKARQAGITREILEIATAQMALN
jgi:F-type H+-transporting ATPase subunit gamma